MLAMISRNSTLAEIKDLVKDAISELYEKDQFLFERNNGKGVCERALVFRFAHYLQNRILKFYVDCDFNSSFEGYISPNGQIIGKERQGKPIANPDGTVTKRFVDIIVHKRDFATRNDLICFEIKKWNNTKKEEAKKDRNNLRVLTSIYGYVYGFHVFLHRKKQNCKWTIFHKGDIVEQKAKVFENEAENKVQAN